MLNILDTMHVMFCSMQANTFSYKALIKNVHVKRIDLILVFWIHHFYIDGREWFIIFQTLLICCPLLDILSLNSKF